ncbi:MarR family winged helix-turn-helix transcriptional regulator [Tropicimonas sp. IMCC34043]|uniref:MarR family winged helix-turn-helix transcriptional regulator n=1 Tax=Tropicimonas sp. IMCC34043 TaxID=2248760 RepID=UPI001E50E4E1|nr:MarR family transcriptional regulator [Tropicimonas sp. IMCC34043]
MDNRKPDQTVGEVGSEELSEGTIREFLGYNLKRAYMVLNPATQAALAELDLRIPSFSCLSVILANPGIAPSALAAQLSMERSNIVVILDELETRNLISRAQMKTDRRRYSLTATVRGRRLHDKAVEAIHRAESHLLRGLSADERQLLVRLVNRIETTTTD